MGDRKSRILTYLLSLIGGLFGLHHLYLGRTQHALLWATTFGGFIIGTVYELIFLLPKYIREANKDRSVLHQYLLQSFQRKSPSFEIGRLCGQYLTALFYGFITFYAFPERWQKDQVLSVFVGFCCALAIAIGTQLFGTLGPRKCSFVWPLLGALIGIPFLLLRIGSSPSFNVSVFLSSCFFEWKIEWSRDYLRNLSDSYVKDSIATKTSMKKTESFNWKSLVYFGVGTVIFASVFAAAVHQNLQVDMNGQRVKIQDVLRDFLKSQQFNQFYRQICDILREIWQFYNQYGFKGLWKQIWMILDSESEKQAYFILNLNSDASQKTIENQCRTLSRQWHPDRYRNLNEKRKAEQMFVNIQQACNRLSNERKRRQSINRRKRENPL